MDSNLNLVLVEDNTDAHITALERDPPAPPSVANDVIRGGVPGAIHGL